MSIRIITDSSADLTLEDAQRLHIQQVHLHVQIGPKSYLAGKDLMPEEFYPLLRTEKAFPTTSQPSPDAFLQIFEAAQEAGDQVVCILLSSVLSGTYQSAKIAQGICGYEEIYLVDSLSATAGVRLLAEQGCALRDAGLSAPEIARQLTELVPRVHVWGVIDTLEYLYKGGRLNALQAGIGTVAKLKPLVGTKEGHVSVVGKAFGFAAGIKQLLKLMEDMPADEQFPIYRLYTDDMERDVFLREKLVEAGISEERQIPCCIGPTIGTHLGPGGLGVAYIAK